MEESGDLPLEFQFQFTMGMILLSALNFKVQRTIMSVKCFLMEHWRTMVVPDWILSNRRARDWEVPNFVFGFSIFHKASSDICQS